MLVATTLALLLAADVPASPPREPAPMRLVPERPLVLVEGPTPEERSALEWLAARPDALVRLPVTLVAGRATLGGPDGPALRLDDAALGVSLADRVRQLCPEAQSCALRLTGIFRPGAPPTLALRRIPERADDSSRLQRARSPACLAVRLLRPLHCARGRERCERCREHEARPAVPKLLDLCPEGDLARPTVQAGDGTIRVYDVLRSFPDAAAARAFAAEHGVTDVQLP